MKIQELLKAIGFCFIAFISTISILYIAIAFLSAFSHYLSGLGAIGLLLNIVVMALVFVSWPFVIWKIFRFGYDPENTKKAIVLVLKINLITLVAGIILYIFAPLVIDPVSNCYLVDLQPCINPNCLQYQIQELCNLTKSFIGTFTMLLAIYILALIGANWLGANKLK